LHAEPKTAGVLHNAPDRHNKCRDRADFHDEHHRVLTINRGSSFQKKSTMALRRILRAE
jgi:hypothetical protein